MFLGVALSDAIELCPSACANLNGQPDGAKLCIERPTSRVDRGSIFERQFRLCVQMGMSERGGSLRAFGLITVVAG